MIIKRKHENDYTILSNGMLQDAGVSFAARGLLAYMLSLPADWNVYEKELQRHTTDGRTAIHTAMRELMQAGYVCKTGARERVRYYVDEYPHTQEDWKRYFGRTSDLPVPSGAPRTAYIPDAGAPGTASIPESRFRPVFVSAETPAKPAAGNPQSQCLNSAKPMLKTSIAQCRKSTLPNAENLQIQSKQNKGNKQNTQSQTRVCENSEPEKLFLKIWQTTPGNIFNSLARLESPAEWKAFWRSTPLTCDDVNRVLQNVIADVQSGALERRYIPKTPDRFALGGGFTRHQSRYQKQTPQTSPYRSTPVKKSLAGLEV
ncbi:MAG: hypothetical protein LBG90_04085 [Spirochaetaceae bacterium]|jgi:hypothetical protein|nr:hypothetical protein [Spirochaetaceae bacterium]